jgi:Ca-activated chloride channel homolog
MQWLYPAGAWALLSIAVITALYLLKRQSVQKAVPSLMLWQKAAADQTASRPFQKLKKNILYFLQLLLALLLAVSLMRPAVSGGVTGETVLIFDLSASMQAQVNGESRLEEAQRKALSLVDGLHEGERVTVLAAGAQVRQCVTRSSEMYPVRTAIQDLTAQNASADLAGAVSLARAMGRDIPGLNIIVFSDTYEGAEDVQVVRVGEGADNAAILTLGVSDAETAYVRVVNYGADTTITVECRADGVLCDVVTADMKEGESRTLTFQVPASYTTLHAHIVQEDALALDNERWYAAQGEDSYRVALAGENVFLEKAIALREDIVLLRTTVQEAAEIEDIDLYVFDGDLPENLPQTGAILAVNPCAQVRTIQCGEAKESTGKMQVSGQRTVSSLCENLTLKQVSLRSYTPLSGGDAVLTIDGDTLLAVSDQDGVRTAVIGFDLHDSNLPLKADFPVLMQNLLSYLLPDVRESVEDATCESAVSLPLDARAESARVILPSGKQCDADQVDTAEQGIYCLEQKYADGETRNTYFAVHGDSSEYDVRTIGAQSGEILSSQLDNAAGHELTIWVLLAFLALLMIEWGVSRRVS